MLEASKPFGKGVIHPLIGESSATRPSLDDQNRDHGLAEVGMGHADHR